MVSVLGLPLLAQIDKLRLFNAIIGEKIEKEISKKHNIFIDHMRLLVLYFMHILLLHSTLW